jgi:hypothetical protein
MSTTPNYGGNFLSNISPLVSNYAAITSPWGTFVKPGGRIAAYVRSTGAQDGEDHFAASGLLVSTINAGLARCRSGQNDIVFVLPGHVESVSTANFWSSLVAGAQIIGLGSAGATNNPTLTWTATASSILLNVANVTVSGLTMLWTGVDDIVAPLTVTGAGCTVANCTITLETASAGVLKGIEVSTGAAGFRCVNNTFLSVGLAQLMTSAPVLISAAVDDVVVADNYISAANPGTSVLGLIAVTAAATNLRIMRNTLIQLNTAGTALFSVTVGAVAATGVIAYNNSLIATDVTSTTSGVTVNAAAAATMGVFENRTKDATATNGVLSPVAAA